VALNKHFKILNAFFLCLLLLCCGSLSAAQQDNSFLIDDLTVEEDGDIDIDLSLAASVARFKQAAGGDDRISRIQDVNEPAENIELAEFHDYLFPNTISFSSYNLTLLNSFHNLPYYLLYHCSKDYLA
jgi:hypothetical protein